MTFFLRTAMVCPILLVSFHNFSQNRDLDSLRTAIGKHTNSEYKTDALNLLSRELFLRTNYDSSLYYANQAMELGKKKGYKNGIADALSNIGKNYFSQGKNDEAMKSLKQALKIFKEIDQKKGIADCYNNMGNVYMTRSDYEKAYKLYSDALEIRKKIEDWQGMADSYNNMGIIKYYQGEYPEALENYLKALKHLKKIGNEKGVARSYSNIGGIHYQQGNYEDALDNFENAKRMQQKIDDHIGVGRSLNNIASIYLTLGRHDEALDNFIEALKIKKAVNDVGSIGRTYINIGSIYYLLAMKLESATAEQDSLFALSVNSYLDALKALELINDRQGLATTYSNLGSIYISMRKDHLAKENLQKGLAIAQEIGSRNDIKAAYQGLSSADSAVGNWKAAYENYRLFITYRDSLLNEENTQKTVEAKMNFEFEQKEMKAQAAQDKKDALHQAAMEKQVALGWSLGGGGLLAILLLLVGFNRYRLKQKNELQRKLNKQQKEQAIAVIESQELERKRIAEDLHDGLGHLLSTVKLNLQALPNEQREHYYNILQLLDQATGEIYNISFNLMPQTLEEEGLVPALVEMTEKIKKSGLVDISLQVHEFDESLLQKQMKFNIYRILQEAVNNILKHAQANEINIQIINQPEGLTIMVEDNGRGFNTKKLTVSGRGLKNIMSRSEWLNAILSIDSTPGHGTTVTIELPANQEA